MDTYRARTAKAAAPTRPAALTNAVGRAAAPVKALGVVIALLVEADGVV